MPITYIGKSSSLASGTGAISVAVPSGYAQNDLLVLLLEGYDAIPAAPSGWTSVDTQSSTHTYFRVCWKLAGSGESSVSVDDSGDSTHGLMMCFRGEDTSAPIHASSKNTAGGTSFSANGVTTTVNECMILVAAGFFDADANDTSNYSSWANSSLTSITEIHDEATSAGSGGGIACAYGGKLLAGTVSATTATTDSSANYSAVITLAIAPAPGSSVILDSYDGSNYNYDGWTTGYIRGQCFSSPSTAYHLTQVSFWVCRNSVDATGTPGVQVKLYNLTGTYGTDGKPSVAIGDPPLATSDTILFSNLSTAYGWVTFTFSTPYSLTANTKYCLGLEMDDDETAEILIGIDTTSPTHGGNYFDSSGGTNWSTNSARDLPFIVRGEAASQNVLVEAATTELVLTGVQPSVLSVRNTSAAPLTGEIQFAGADPAIALWRDAAVFTMAGEIELACVMPAISVNQTVLINAAAGEIIFVCTAPAVPLRQSVQLYAEPGEFTFNGVLASAVLFQNVRIVAEPGEILLEGNEAHTAVYKPITPITMEPLVLKRQSLPIQAPQGRVAASVAFNPGVLYPVQKNGAQYEKLYIESPN